MKNKEIAKMLEAPMSDYMNTEQLEFFRNMLIELHNTTRERIRDAKAQMLTPPELGDQADRATWEEQCSILMRIVDREQKLLPKIKLSLERIRTGDYGYCLETGEPIGIARLMARPTAEVCADVKLCQEMTEHIFYRDREG